MKTKLYLYVLVSLWCIVASTSAFTQQIPNSLIASNGQFIGFYEYKPVNYNANPTKKYPIIIFLHGLGERGDGQGQLPMVLANAIPKYIAAGHTMTFTYNGQTETFLVLSPQLRGDLWDWPSYYVDEMIKYAKQNLRIDTNRIYLTGLSLGGGGVWRYATESYANARGLAAIAPVCGTCGWANVCSSIAAANLPVWAFHAQDDGVVGVGCTLGAIANINSCSPSVAPLMTIYPNGNHWIWDRSYDTAHNWHNPNMYEWFLSHSRSGTAPGPNTPPVARAGADQTITLPTNSVTLNGSASSDPDGSITAYSWLKIGGPAQFNIVNGSSSVATVNNLAQGVYSFQLTVTDNNGATAKDTVLVTVNGAAPAANQPPVALAGADQNITLPTNNTYLFGSGSYDPDGFINSWTWTQISGPNTASITLLSATNVNVSNLVAGTYSFRLVVSDNVGATDDDTVRVIVHPPNQPPVARAGNDQNIQLPTNNVTLNGSASTDADGTITNYAWSKVSGPTQYSITSANNVSTSVTNLVAGTYAFRLVVTDNSGVTDDDTVLINVAPAPPPPNVTPTANAGIDQSIQLPTNSVTLNGSASSDPDGTITAYSWSKVSGPSTYSISNAGSVSTSVSNLTAGVYAFRLVVTDNSGAWDDDTVLVTVAPAPPPPNVAPTANAGNDQSIQLPTNSVTLNGSASTDADGTIAAYAWSKISGPAQYNISNANTVNASVTNLTQGVYAFRLVVTDNNGATDDDTVVVTVLPAPPPPNVAPTSNAGGDQNIQLPTNNTTLNGSASSDADGTITAYAWSYISGPAQYNISNANTVNASVTNLAEGTYAFRLVVTDNDGATDDDTVIVNVSAAPPPPNVPPTANAGNDQSIQLPTNNVTLNGSASTDVDGTITAYAWSKISGPAQYNISNANTVNASVTNLTQGVYAFRLVVTDNNGATDDDTVVVSVLPAPPPPNVAPTANAGSDQTIQLPTNNVNLNGSASSDADGQITGYAWTKISGPASYNIANANDANTAVNNLTEGVYAFRLVVTDNSGATDDDTVLVTVLAAPPPPNIPPTANAGNDQSIQLPTNSVTLNGSASADADGTIVGYAWSKISGPAQFNISSANTVNASVTNLAAGTYAFRLVVTDNSGATDDDTVLINVAPAPPPPNVAPTAHAGNDQSIQLPANVASLDGSLSTDADGTIVSYAWTKVSGPSQYNIANAGATSTSVNDLVEGTYVFRLVVTDNSGATDDDTVIITVSAAPPPPNVPPTANAGNDQSIQLPTNSVTLNGSASTDQDGTITSYAWSKISGPAQYTFTSAGTVVTAVNNLVAGTYAFRLVVTDNNGATDDDTIIVTVAPAPNQLPVARAGNDRTVSVSTAVSLDGSTSYDPDGNIVSYAWNRVSGAAGITIVNATTAVADVVGMKEGVYEFELTVTDNNGATGTDRVTITVTASSNQPPVAKAGNDTTIAVPSNMAWLNGSNSYDADGWLIKFVWRQISGPSAGFIENAGAPATFVKKLQPGGVYKFEVTVTDNEGAVGRDTIEVMVVNNFRYEESLLIYPNPVPVTATVRCVSDSTGDLTLRIIDMNGKFVKQIQTVKGQSYFEQEVTFSDLRPGVYYLEAIIGSKKRMIKKFIKQ